MRAMLKKEAWLHAQEIWQYEEELNSAQRHDRLVSCPEADDTMQ